MIELTDYHQLAMYTLNYQYKQCYYRKLKRKQDREIKLRTSFLLLLLTISIHARFFVKSAFRLTLDLIDEKVYKEKVTKIKSIYTITESSSA